MGDTMFQKICTLCHELKDVDQFPNMKGGRHGKAARCRPCAAQKVREWGKANPEKLREKKKRDRARRPGVYRAREAAREGAQIQRTPKWLTKEQRKQIENYYTEAARLTVALGELYTVDHIIPLRGKSVSGLHVPWNLQVMKGKDNFSKSNSFVTEAD